MTRQGKVRERTLENVQAFWSTEAEEWGHDPRVTIRDHYFRLAEVNLIRNVIRGRNVLDAGCGTGWNSAFYAAVAKSVTGFDYTEGLIERASQMLTDQKFRTDQCWAGLTPWGAPPMLNNMMFAVQDVLDLPYDPASFDAVVCQRLLINLPSWELQQQALANLVKTLMPGGILVIAEVTEDGHGRVNALRDIFGLDPLERYWHNLYIHHNQFMDAMEALPLKVLGPGNLDIYQFLSKVFYPAMVAPEEPQFMSAFNLAAATVSMFYTDSSHLNMELYNFLDEVFRGALAFHWTDVPWVEAYNRVLTRIGGMNLDAMAIRGCSHQTLFLAERA